MFVEYFSLSFFLIFSFILSSIIFIASYLLIVRQYDIEKISTYECGFDPFDEDTRGKFDVRFYLVSILFIVFDIEVAYLFPWAVCLPFLDFFGFFIMVLFLFILTLGFVYEWKKGALDW